MTHAQIDVVNGTSKVHVFVDHDGYPEVVEPMLQEVIKKGYRNPLEVALEILYANPDWAMWIATKDHRQNGASYRYRVNLSTPKARITTKELA
jgi:hypothetical protein